MDKRIFATTSSSQTCCEILKTSSMGDFVMRLLLSSDVSGIALNQMIHSSPKPLRHPLMEFARCSSTTASDASNPHSKARTNPAIKDAVILHPKLQDFLLDSIAWKQDRREKGDSAGGDKGFRFAFPLILPYNDY
jgi:hypothetical protein